ncbi:MAG: hypothetical protein JWM57_2746, partial [Phycisphaerales bacterium]|nr:hypothetical protein [Phycisphaerales bacterium]
LKTDPELGQNHPLLSRECFRKAVLIAARDELGLTTRDEVLGEPVRGTGTLTLIPDIDIRRPMTLRLFVDGKPDPVFTAPKADFNIWSNKPQDLIAVAEALSRKELVDALHKAGLNGQPNKTDKDGPISEEAAIALEHPELLTQLAGLRLVHQQIRTDGESPARLAALARGYANAYQLSAFIWGSTPKLMAARALLYGQRAVVKFPNDPTALAGRAYAEALVGLPKQAMADLDAANTAGAPDDWRSELIRALTLYDAGTLSAVTNKQQAPWGRLFATIAVEHSKAVAATIGSALATLKVTPDSQRAIAVIIANAGPGLANWASAAGGDAFAFTLGRADGLPGLPEPIANMIRILRGPGKNPSGRMKVVAALHKAGDADATEPSWHVIAHEIEDITFMNVEQEAWHIAEKWGIDATDFLTASEPLVAGHRYHGFLDYLRAASGNNNDAKNAKLDAVNIDDPTYAMGEASGAWDGRPEAKSHAAWNILVTRADNTATDLDYYVSAFSFGHGLTDPKYVDGKIKRMEAIAPDSPMLQAVKINLRWPEAEAKFEGWLKGNGDHPALTMALARHYADANDLDKSIAMYERYVAGSPDWSGFHGMAKLYLKRGDEGKWLESLQRFLKAPDPGLQHASVQAEISRHLVAIGRPAEAIPYARDAAETGAAWATDAYSEACEATGDWATAEKLQIENGEHYDRPTKWPEWCVRTGHGDLAAAKKQLLKYELSIRNRTDREGLTDRISVFLIAGDDKQAETVATQVAGRTNDPWAGLVAASLAAARHNDAARDRLLAQLTDPAKPFKMPGGSKRAALVSTASYLKELIKEKGSPSTDRLTLILGDDPDDDAANVYYFVGQFVLSRGDVASKALAKDLLMTAATTESSKTPRSLAARQLRTTFGVQALSTTKPAAH